MTTESPVPTRLSLGWNKEDDAFDVLWDKGDVMTVVGTKTTTFRLSSGEGTSSGIFSGSLESAGSGPYYGFFPSGRKCSVGSSSISLDIPSSIEITADDISEVPSICTISQGAAASLHNIFGLVKITVDSPEDVTIRKARLHDLGGNILWGSCTVPLDCGIPSYDDISIAGGDNTLEIVFIDNLALVDGEPQSFYVPVPPGALDRGFSVAFYEYDPDCDEECGRIVSIIQKVSNPVVAQRSVVIDMDRVELPSKSESADPLARGYYKTLFVDAGMRLSNYYTPTHLPWIAAMGLSGDYEYFASDTLDSNRSFYQSGVLVEAPNSYVKWSDANGVLLYPDGEPRFRSVYVNGGSASGHGYSLGKGGPQRFHDFYVNGGSYFGTCAGAFIASTYSGGTTEYYNRYNNSDETRNCYFGIWPGVVYPTKIPINITTYGSAYTAMKVVGAFSGGGYSFAVGDTVERVRHHGGCYMSENSMNKQYDYEALTTYQYTEQQTSNELSYTQYNLANQACFGAGKYDSRVDKVAIFAYKKDSGSGRAIICGSHPERITRGKQLQMFVALMNHALSGNGDSSVKGSLSLGKKRSMDKSTEDNEPLYTKIGDRQYHHFIFENENALDDFTLTLESGTDSGVDLYLALRRSDFAWISDADYVVATSGGNKTLSVKHLEAGTWYVSVYCPTTVTSTATHIGSKALYFFNYTGNTQVLDGTAYSITASLGTKSLAVTKSDMSHFSFDE